MANMIAPYISAEGLSRYFGGLVAVDHVDFVVPRGEIMLSSGLMGQVNRHLSVCYAGAFPYRQVALFLTVTTSQHCLPINASVRVYHTPSRLRQFMAG